MSKTIAEVFIVNVYKLWYEVKLTDKIKFQEMIFPEGVSYDYAAGQN